jgi:hypothetical protein
VLGPGLPGYRVKLSYLAIPNREPEHAKAVRSLGRQMDRICSVVDLHERYPAIAQIGGYWHPSVEAPVTFRAQVREGISTAATSHPHPGNRARR